MDFATPAMNPATPTATAPAPRKSNAGIGCIVILGAAIALWAIWSSNSKPTAINGLPGATHPSSNDAAKPGLELLDSKAVGREYGWAIVGHVRNNTAKIYSYVQVSFNLYDNAGNQVGSAFTNVNNLESSGTWKFEALVSGTEARKWKFKELTGF
jgi:hypothetical protein